MQLIKLDVTSEEDTKLAKKIVDDTLSENPHLRFYAMVNNAGLGGMNMIEWHDNAKVDDMQRLLDVNLLGAVRMCRTFLPLLRASKGRVVNVTSFLGHHVLPHNSAYGASKKALQGLFTCRSYHFYKLSRCHVSISFLGCAGI